MAQDGRSLPEESTRSTRHTTVYDAVARRISRYHGFISASLYQAAGQGRDQATNHARPADPDDALFNFDHYAKVMKHLNHKPTSRFVPPDVSTDVKREALYAYTKWLPQELELPDGELLEAVHTYASEYYSQLPEMKVMYRALDGTALVALGILLEEMARENVGETGDLAFLEDPDEDNGSIPKRWNGYRYVPLQTGRRDAQLMSRSRTKKNTTNKGNSHNLEMLDVDDEDSMSDSVSASSFRSSTPTDSSDYAVNSNLKVEDVMRGDRDQIDHTTLGPVEGAELMSTISRETQSTSAQLELEEKETEEGEEDQRQEEGDDDDENDDGGEDDDSDDLFVSARKGSPIKSSDIEMSDS